MEYASLFDEIHQKIPIVQVLQHYGYPVADYGDRAQSFPCDLHGNGMDTRPSAMVYPESGSFYCFACGTQRDCIDLVRIKEGLHFLDAVKWLTNKFQVQLVTPIRPKNSMVSAPEFKPRVKDPLPLLDYEAVLLRVDRLFSGLWRGNNVLGWRKTWLLWEERDRLDFLVRHKKLTPEVASLHLMSLHRRTMERLNVSDRKADSV